MLVLSALVLASEFGGWTPPAPMSAGPPPYPPATADLAFSALVGLGVAAYLLVSPLVKNDDTMISVFFGGPPPRARTEPRGERGADVLENGRNGDVRAPRRQCSAQI